MPRKQKLSVAAALGLLLLFHKQAFEWLGAALFIAWLFLTN
jgi:hypothetical protein